MPLPKTLEDLSSLKKLLSKMSKVVVKKNVAKFPEFADDAKQVIGSSIASKILSFKKAIEAGKEEKITAASNKVKEAFVKIAAKVDEKLVKVKAAEKAKAEKAKAKEAAKKAKEAAKKAKAKAKEAAKKDKAVKPKKAKKSKKPKSASKKASASFMWGGEFEEDADSMMDF